MGHLISKLKWTEDDWIYFPYIADYHKIKSDGSNLTNLNVHFGNNPTYNESGTYYLTTYYSTSMGPDFLIAWNANGQIIDSLTAPHQFGGFAFFDDTTVIYNDYQPNGTNTLYTVPISNISQSTVFGTYSEEKLYILSNDNNENLIVLFGADQIRLINKNTNTISHSFPNGRSFAVGYTAMIDPDHFVLMRRLL